MASQARNKIVVVKTGSGIVMDRVGMVDRATVRSIAMDIATLRQSGWAVVWVASGAVSRGKAALDYPQGKELTLASLQAAGAVGQGLLYRELSGQLERCAVATAQVLLTFGEIASRESYRRAVDAFLTLIRWRVVPIVNENDSVTTEGISFGNNDFLAAQIAALLGASRLVLLTNVPGVLTDDPSQSTKGEVIREVAAVDDLLDQGYSRVGGRSGALGTGGMRGKLRAAQLASMRGVPSLIGSLESGSIVEHVEGSGRGTTVLPATHSMGRGASYRFWLQHAVVSAGTVVVDAGAARALVDRGASLLVVGVANVKGDFAAGDAVDVCDDMGRTIAKGVSRYSVRELRLLLDVPRRPGRDLPDEVIHRDEMVLLVPPREQMH